MAAGGSKRGGKPGGQAPRPEVSTRPRLVVLLDGVAMAEDAARELWTKFSAHMDQNQGDLTGFARQYGFASVAPEYRKGQAVLIVRRNPLN